MMETHDEMQLAVGSSRVSKSMWWPNTGMQAALRKPLMPNVGALAFLKA